MVKGYETLVDPDTRVDVKTGMAAALRLQALLDSRAGQPDIADLMVQINRIVEAVRSTVPESLWPEILRKVSGEDPPAERLDEPTGALDEADEQFDPLEFVEGEDEDDF